MTDSPSLPPHFDLIELQAADSVLEEARRRADDGAEEGTLVWAHTQTAARTRRGGEWYSPAGNLHCALILRPDYANASAWQLGYLAAVSAGTAIAGLVEPMTGLRYQWPNKLLINDLVAGCVQLAVGEPVCDPYAWMAVGLAVNVAAHPPNPEPEEFNSIHASGSPRVELGTVLEAYTRHFLSSINRWADEGFEPVRHAWSVRANGIGEHIDVVLDTGTVSGRFLEVGEDGALVIETETGDRRVTLGEYFGL